MQRPHHYAERGSYLDSCRRKKEPKPDTAVGVTIGILGALWGLGMLAKASETKRPDPQSAQEMISRYKQRDQKTVDYVSDHLYPGR
jgi:hypothetical protein